MTAKEAIEKCNFMNDALNFQRVESDECSCALQMAIAALEEIQKYHAIGTVEECRCAMDKQLNQDFPIVGLCAIWHRYERNGDYMANSTDMAYRRDNFILDFLDSACSQKNGMYSQQDTKECNEAISEYECMLQHAIDIGDKQEIAFLRSEIQHVKAEKRNIKRMMKNRMEPALTQFSHDREFAIVRPKHLGNT